MGSFSFLADENVNFSFVSALRKNSYEVETVQGVGTHNYLSAVISGMPRAAKKYRHVSEEEGVQGGEPIVEGTRFPVRSVVVYVLREGMLPEELVKEFPQLSLAAVYEALSYYYDHREEMDRLIDEQRETERARGEGSVGMS